MSTQEIIYDVIGLGFGPANLAVAGAFVDRAGRPPVVPLSKILFIERQQRFEWHPGMLLPGARMQINFLKDLATLRSPQSEITFVSYLHSQNRLLDFINRGSNFPTRKEYSDYLAWAARLVQEKGVTIAYGENVVGVGEKDTKTIEVQSIVLSTGERVARLTKNLIVSSGGEPRIPKPLESIQGQRGRIIHSSTYLMSVETLLKSLQCENLGGRSLRIAIVGCGQSAAEVTLELHSRLQSVTHAGEDNHTLDMIIRKGSLKPSDDSPFSNEIFNPDGTDVFFGVRSSSARQRIRKEYANTNYGVVNPQTLERLYEVLYEQKLDDGIYKRTGCSTPKEIPRINILPYSEILSAVVRNPVGRQGGGNEQPGPITVIMQHALTHQVYQKVYDAVICATGYQRKHWLQLLASSSIGKYFDLDSEAQQDVRLAVETELGERGMAGSMFELADHIADEDNSGGDTPSTGFSTQTTPQSSVGDRPPKRLKTVHISRVYRLVPKPQDSKESLEARIYVQGIAEETHGLSDTLLSVVSVRAGEIVDDICAGLSHDVGAPRAP
ncbi:L-lysine 6-monooxygenase (NADPH-requiring)-domain-containing protein [Pisolithus marmoratus]|nr:L-lysine 6-monooxygenase (NADPH-requiring)-domain-containing protein [Pisolithus marmoratus]